LDFSGSRTLSLATCTHKRGDHRAAAKVEIPGWKFPADAGLLLRLRREGAGGDAAVSTSSSFSKDSTVLLAESGRQEGGSRQPAAGKESLSRVRLKTRDNRDCHLLACFGTPTPRYPALTRPLSFFIGSTPPPSSPFPAVDKRDSGALARAQRMSSLSLSLSLQVVCLAAGHPRPLFPIIGGRADILFSGPRRLAV